jgi:hypothetical protein
MRPALAGALAFAAPLALYTATSYRDVTYWDVGEMDTVPWILGIAHPPGFPAYTLIGWVFAHAVPLGSVAFRMSLLSALAVSAAAWLVYRIVLDETEDRIAGLGAGWLFAAGLVTWTHATRAEVHALELAAFALTLFFALRWHRAPNSRDLFAGAFVFGTAVAIHPVALLMLPGLLMLAISRLHETQTPPLVAAAGIACVCAAAWYAYLPLRSAYVNAHGLDPLAAYGINGGAFWNYDDPSTLAGFAALVGAEGIDVPSAFQGYTHASFFTGAVGWAATAVHEFTLVGLFLAVLGAIRFWRSDPVRTVAFCLCAVASAAFAFGFADESDVQRYFLPSFFAIACFAGAGIAALRRYDRRIGVAGVVAALACVVWLAGSQRFLFNQPFDDRARKDVTDVFQRTPNDAILIASWVLAPALAYTAYVQHAAGGRVVVSAWYGDEQDRLREWMARRPVYVVGTPEGSVPGLRLERLDARTELYRVVPQ